MSMRIVRRKRRIWPVLVPVLIIAAFTAAFLVLTKRYTGDTIRKGISIENTDVSWLTAEDARVLVEDRLKKSYGADMLTLTYAEKKWDIKLSDIDYSYKVGDAVERAFSIGREGNIFKKLIDSITLSKNGLKLDVDVGFDREKLRSRLEEIKKQCDSAAKNASVTYSGGKFEYTRDIPFRELDVDTNLKLVENYLSKRDFGDIN